MANSISKIFSDKYACLITDRISRKYFSGIDVEEGLFLLSKSPIYFADARYFSMVKDMLKGSGITPVLLENLDTVKVHLNRQKIKKLFIDFEKTYLCDYLSYKKFGVKLIDGSSELKKFRSVKTQEEIENVKIACEIIEKAFYKTLESVKVGITEKELCKILQDNIIHFGGEGESFNSIVAFSKNSAVPHHITGDTVLEDNSVILIDTGCKYKGYCSDFTRTVFYGTPSSDFLNAYEAVKVANELCIEKIKAGFTCKDCDKIARDYLETKNLSGFFTHSLGHGVGLEIHESPYLSRKSKDKVVENNVFTIEPGVYMDGKFGIRIEDTVVIKDGVDQRLFTDDKKLIIL